MRLIFLALALLVHLTLSSPDIGGDHDHGHEHNHEHRQGRQQGDVDDDGDDDGSGEGARLELPVPEMCVKRKFN